MSKNKENLLSDDPIVAVPVEQSNAEAEADLTTTVAKKTARRKPTSKRRGATKPLPDPITPTKPVLGVYRMHDDVQMPHLATEQSACFDMRAYLKEGDYITVATVENNLITRKVQTYSAEIDGVGLVLNPGERVLMPTGIIFDIPEGYSVRAHPRSGCSFKEALTLINGEGVIDSDYVEEGFMPLVNHSGVRIFIKHGERCAQVEMIEDLKYEVDEVQTRPAQKTSRAGGFGHSGKK